MSPPATPPPEVDHVKAGQPATKHRSGLPLFQGVRPITGAGVARDALAGFQLAAMNIPQALGYTKIAGTPSCHRVLHAIAAAAGVRRVRLVAVSRGCCRFRNCRDSGWRTRGHGASGQRAICGPGGNGGAADRGVSVAGPITQAGFLADFLSQTVLIGFLTGVGFQVGIAVLGEMLGVEVHSRRSVGQLLEVFRGLSQVHMLTVAISATVVVSVFAFHWLAPKVPGPLIAVVCAITASVVWDFAGHGVTIVGPVAGGLPHLGLPDVRWKDVWPLVPVAGSCFVMIVAQSAATARFYAARHHQHSDEDTDLVGLSAANATAALSGTFVVDGSPTQTAMVESSGGQSQLAQAATATVVALVLLFLTRLCSTFRAACWAPSCSSSPSG